ncbi:hypothetical protein [Dyella sp.]|uniref:hypothetical protein n=1 Tax=Dyella sp. TaxID=1869338 RepID=UPI002ED12531
MNNIFLKQALQSPLRSASLRALGLIALLCLAVPAVHAQVAVQDQTVGSNTGDIKSSASNIDTNTKNIDTNTKNINNQLKIAGKGTGVGGTDDAFGKRVEDPKQAWDTTMTYGDSSVDNQCNKYADVQKSECQELVKTEQAQYLYMVVMYKNTKDRNDILTKLIQERNALTEDQYGKIEENTNKLETLRALMDLDQQQMQTTMNAYQSRIHWLENQLAQDAKAAMSGEPKASSWSIGGFDLGSMASSVVSGVVLKGALSAAQSSEPSGMKTLSITDSNGF